MTAEFYDTPTECSLATRLVHTSHHDWKHSRKLDRSDEAVKADLEKHGARQ